MTTRRMTNTERYTQLTQDEVLTVARKFDADRRLRAVEQFKGYILRGEGSLIKKDTGEGYECEDVRHFASLPGTVVYIGCDCPDEADRLRPLRAAMDAKNCIAPCYCKHHYMRLLYSGHTLFVNGLNVRAKIEGEDK